MTLIKHMKRVGKGLILFVTISFSACGVKSGIDLNGKDLIKVEVKELQAPKVFGLKSDTSKIENGKVYSTSKKEQLNDFRYDYMFK